MSLVTVEEFKDYLRDEKPTEDDAQLQQVLDTTDDLLEDICARRIVLAAGAATARLYAPRSQNCDVIRIHDCTSVTAVTNNGTTVAPSAYQLEPIGGLSWAGATVPYEQIRYINSRWRFDGFRATVSVTAVWGMPEIPPQLIRAAHVLAKDIYSHREVSFGTLGIAGDLTAVRARQAPLIADLTKRYRREEAKAGIGGATQ